MPIFLATAVVVAPFAATLGSLVWIARLGRPA
jgi:hypothetical protein